MEMRRLGRTGIEITPIGLGCWQFSQGAGFMARFWETSARRPSAASSPR